MSPNRMTLHLWRKFFRRCFSFTPALSRMAISSCGLFAMTIASRERTPQPVLRSDSTAVAPWAAAAWPDAAGSSHGRRVLSIEIQNPWDNGLLLQVACTMRTMQSAQAWGQLRAGAVAGSSASDRWPESEDGVTSESKGGSMGKRSGLDGHKLSHGPWDVAWGLRLNPNGTRGDQRN
jgi:hypothetical protein